LNEDGEDRLVTTNIAGVCRIPRAPGAGLNVLMLSASDATGERQGYLQSSLADLEERADPLRIILKPSRQITVRVIDRAGAAVSEALVCLIQKSGGQTMSHGRTGADGWIRLSFPADVEVETVIALKSGMGYDNWHAEADIATTEPRQFPKEITLTLNGAQTVRVLAVDTAGRPVPGIAVMPSFIVKPGRPLQSIGLCRPAYAFTDAHGIATLDWLPVDFRQNLVIFSHSEAKYFCLDPPNVPAVNVDAGASRDVTMTLLAFTKISGRVTGIDGKPAAGIRVQSAGSSTPKISRFHGASASTAADGTYEINACPGFAFIVSVADEAWAAATRSPVIVHDDRPVGGVDFQLLKGTVIRGTVTTGNNERPAAAKPILLTQHVGAFPQELLTGDETAPDRYPFLLRRSVATDASGRYKFRVGPGDYTLTTANGPKTELDKTEELTISEEPEVLIDFHLPEIETRALAGLIVGPQGEPVQGAVVRGLYTFRDPADRRNARELTKMSDAGGVFRFERNAVPMWLYASSADGALAALARANAEQDSITIQLAPAASVVGRLVDDGAPVAGVEVTFHLQLPVDAGANRRRINDTFDVGTVSTATDGRFALRGLIVGGKYRMSVGNVGERGGALLPALVMDAPRTVNAGFVNLPAPRRLVATDQGSRVSQIDFEKLAAIRFHGSTGLAGRISETLADARRAYRRVLMVLGDPASPATQLLFKLLDGHDTPPALKRPLADFQPLYVTIKDEAAVALLVKTYGVKAYQIDAGKLNAPVLVVLGDDGVVIATQPIPAAGDPLQLDVELLSGFLKRHVLPTRDAEKLLKAASRRARDENKRILLQHSGADTYPSRLLTRFVDEHPDLLERDYVYVNIDAYRSMKGDEIIRQFRNMNGDVPWMAVLNADGVKLADSDSPDGNIAFPWEPAGINYFIDRMLKPTAQRLTKDELDELRKALTEK
jgi:hypothetical protein